MWKTVVNSVSSVQASVIKSVLEAANIKVIIKKTDQNPSAYFGEGAIVNILVPEDSYDDAKKIIEEGYNEKGTPE
jgi:hypothetical protein